MLDFERMRMPGEIDVDEEERCRTWMMEGAGESVDLEAGDVDFLLAS